MKLSPLWRAAPLVLRHYPGILVALIVGAAVLSLSAAAPPLYSSASAGALVADGIAAGTVTTSGAGLAIRKNVDLRWRNPSGQGSLADVIGDLFRSRAADPALAPPTVGIASDVIAVSHDPDGAAIEARLFAGTDAVDNVEVLEGREGRGIWLPDSIADPLRVSPGDVILLSGSRGSEQQLVDGIYRDLTARPLRAYWFHWNDDIRFAGRCPVDCPTLPQFVIADLDRVNDLFPEVGGSRVDFVWQAPVATRSMTLDAARRVADGFRSLNEEAKSASTPLGRALACCEGSFFLEQFEVSSSMPSVVDVVERRLIVQEGPGRLLQATSLVVGFAVMAAAAAFSRRARRTEADLLFVQGSPTWSVAARAGLESLIPCAIGGLVGLFLAASLVVVAGPAGAIGGSAYAEAARLSAVSIASAIVLVCSVSGLAHAHRDDRVGLRRGLVGSPPLELLIVVVAFLVLQRLRAGDALIRDRGLGLTRPSTSLLVFPFLFLVGLGLVAARLVGISLRTLSPASGRTGPSGFLAMHRLASAPRRIRLVLGAVALCVGVSFYARTMVLSLESTFDSKARVYVGSDVQGRVEWGTLPPRDIPLPWTRVSRLHDAGELLPAGTPFDLLAIDPRSFGRVAYWDPSFAEGSLQELVERLTRPGDGRLRAILVGDPAQAGVTGFDVGAREVDLDLVGRARAFPGMTSRRPLLVVAERALLAAYAGDQNPLGVSRSTTELWLKGDESAAVAALEGSERPPELILTVSQVKDIPAISATIDTFIVLNGLGLAALLLLIVGMLMYLQSRQRSQIVSFGLSLRMGMTRWQHGRALAFEVASLLLLGFLVGAGLAAVLAVLVIPLIDPLSTVPPDPVYVLPGGSILVLPLVLVLVAVSIGWLSTARSRRVDLGEVMRTAE